METIESTFLSISRSLPGKWQSERKHGMMYEEWKVQDDSTLLGRAWIEKEGREQPGESIVLQLRGGVVQYIPTVHNQNEGKAIPFRLVSSENNTFIFENMQHDFPQRILYSVVSDDFLSARIEGVINGVHKTVEFPFRRVQ